MISGAPPYTGPWNQNDLPSSLTTSTQHPSTWSAISELLKSVPQLLLYHQYYLHWLWGPLSTAKTAISIYIYLHIYIYLYIHIYTYIYIPFKGALPISPLSRLAPTTTSAAWTVTRDDQVLRDLPGSLSVASTWQLAQLDLSYHNMDI